MVDNKLFAIEQPGFRTGHFTDLAALHLVNHLTMQIDMGKVLINTSMVTNQKHVYPNLQLFRKQNKLVYFGMPHYNFIFVSKLITHSNHIL